MSKRGESCLVGQEMREKDLEKNSVAVILTSLIRHRRGLGGGDERAVLCRDSPVGTPTPSSSWSWLGRSSHGPAPEKLSCLLSWNSGVLTQGSNLDSVQKQQAAQGSVTVVRVPLLLCQTEASCPHPQGGRDWMPAACTNDFHSGPRCAD